MKTERETFDEELAALASRVGERNRRLFVVALKGRAAGLDGEELTRRIVEASGNPPLSAAEVRRAVDKVYKLPQTCRKQRESGGVAPRCDSRKRHGNPRLAGVLRCLSPQNTIEKRSSKGGGWGEAFVREMIEQGGGEASSKELLALSPVQINPNARIQAAQFALALEESDSGLYFVGNPRQKRTKDRHKDAEGGRSPAQEAAYPCLSW